MDKSAASAASVDYVKFQAVNKSGASAASPKAKSMNQDSGERPGDGSAGRRRPRGVPQAVGEAALAANLIKA